MATGTKFTVTGLVVSLTQPKSEVAVNVTFPPWQNVVGPFAVIPTLIPDPVPILIAIGEDVTGPQSGLGVMV